MNSLSEQNPYLAYIGGLDVCSRATMVSTARLVAQTLSNSASDPTIFAWHALDYGAVLRLRSRLRERGFAPRTVNKALVLVRSILREAWLLDLISGDAYERVRQVKDIRFVRLPAGRLVERDEVARLLVDCHHPEDVLGLRDAALIALLSGAGLREGEAVKLRRVDIDPATWTIRVLGKGRKERRAYLETAFEAPLRRLLACLPEDEETLLLPRVAPEGVLVRPLRGITTQAVHKTLAGRARRAGLRPFTPHDLRRSFITSQLDHGVDPLRLARAVGHSDPKTTMLYDRRTIESDRRAIQGGGAEATPPQEAAFLAALGGADPFGVLAEQDVCDVPFDYILDPAWRAPLRGLRRPDVGYIYSIRAEGRSLYVGKSAAVEVTALFAQAAAAGRAVYRWPPAVWTVRVWPDSALASSLVEAKEHAIALERPRAVEG